jgi:hypothetical protein
MYSLFSRSTKPEKHTKIGGTGLSHLAEPMHRLHCLVFVDSRFTSIWELSAKCSRPEYIWMTNHIIQQDDDEVISSSQTRVGNDRTSDNVTTMGDEFSSRYSRSTIGSVSTIYQCKPLAWKSIYASVQYIFFLSLSMKYLLDHYILLYYVYYQICILLL